MAALLRSDAPSVTRILLHTFGCKANQYDTEVVRQALEASGATIVEDGSEVDAAIVNSCTVTHVSEAKMRGFVRRIARSYPSVRTVVVGCAATLDDGAIAALPNVVHVVAGTDPTEILEALKLPPVTAQPILQSFARGTRAWLKIQDGCDEHCTFCATTLARGSSRSREPHEIVEEALALSTQHAEIVLTGVHIGSYGADFREEKTLSELAETLIRRVPRTRFRLTSVEATQIDERLVDLMVGEPDRLAPHVHAPLQSGSDRVLRTMGRHWYTAQTYCARIEQLAGKVQRLGLGADVLVGFPSETDEDFARTREVIEALPFTYVHVFPYSERADAAAQRIGPPVDPQVAASRSTELRNIVAEKGMKYRRKRSGERSDVVLLRRGSGRFEGLTEDYLDVTGATDRALPSRFPASLLLDRGGQLTASRVEGDQ